MSWRCVCGARYETLVVGGRFVGRFTDVGEEQDACPTCEGTDREALVSGGGVAIPSNAYPQYNRGLKAWVTGPEHYKQLCREQGKVPLEGASWDASVISPLAAGITEKERKQREMRQRQKQRDDSPEGKRVAGLMADPRFMQDMLERAGHTVQG